MLVKFFYLLKLFGLVLDLFSLLLNRKFWALVLMVVSINCTWQLIRGRYVLESGTVEGVRIHYFVNEDGVVIVATIGRGVVGLEALV